MGRKSIIMADTLVDDDWEFAKGLKLVTMNDWEVFCWNNAGLKKKTKRIFGYFIHSFFVFNRRNEIKSIISWQQFYGLLFAFYCSIFHTKKVINLTVMTFIYKEKSGVIGKIYKKFIKRIISSGYIDHIVVFASQEVEYYSQLFGVESNIFVYYPLGIQSKKNLDKSNIIFDYPFLLSVGRSNRDYDFLLECASILPYKIVIISDSVVVKDIPNNVTVLDNIKGDDYLKILEESYAVLITLKNENISSGQLVILQAMQYKKPIIITESNAIKDYIQDGYNALVVKKDKNKFCRSVIKLMKDKRLYEYLAGNGYDKYSTCSLVNLGKNVGKLYI